MIWMIQTILKMIPSNKIAVVITAAGSSTRIGSGSKKEYLQYKNGTVLSNCAKTFLKACVSKYEIIDFIVTCPQNGQQACKAALADVDFSSLQCGLKIVEGASTRQKSVYNALCQVSGDTCVVAIHDGARPFVTEQIIQNSIDGAIEYGASVPGVTPVDTQKEIDENGFIVRHLQRSLLTAVQTPQCFQFHKLLDAHMQAMNDGKEYTDDTEIWGVYCGRVKTVPGDVNNIKITYPEDLRRLESK